MELREMITAAEEKAGGRKQLATILDQNPEALTSAKAHRRGLPAYACISLAKLINVNPLEVIAASELVTEKKEERRAVFLPFVQHLSLAKHLAMATMATGLTVLEIATSLIKDI